MNVKSKRPAGFAFLALGIALGAVGMSGQTAFVGVGVVFLCLGIVFLTQSRNEEAGNGRRKP